MFPRLNLEIGERILFNARVPRHGNVLRREIRHGQADLLTSSIVREQLCTCIQELPPINADRSAHDTYKGHPDNERQQAH